MKSPSLRRKYSLDEAFEMPALNKEDVKAAILQPRANLGGIAAGKSPEVRWVSDILQETMLVSVEKVDVPVKENLEARLCLIGRRGSMSEEHHQIHPSREFAEERSVVLDRMRGDDSETHDRLAPEPGPTTIRMR